MKTKTDRAKCLALAKALWPQEENVHVETKFGHHVWFAGVDSDGWAVVFDELGNDAVEGPTREKALASLLKKLRRLATQRQARLAKALEGAR